MSRSARIAEIIAKRQPLAQRIETAIGNLEALRGALKSIEMKRKELLPKLKDETARDKLEGIDFISAHDAITSQLVHLEKLESRFSRKTLNIGVIGMMRQGKSTLLQSLTGLDNSVIPAKSGGVCTAVRSKIRHQPHGETQAAVSFHSELSFVNEVLTPYYNDLGLTPVPHTLADFIDSELPSLNLESTSQQQAIYNRFVEDYHKNRHSFQKYLKSIEVGEAIAIDKIQEYVTHLHGKQGDEQYKYLAVKEVEISCTFPNTDVGKITVVDIPGLGDFKSSDRQLMLETLGKEVDVILMIRRPDVIGDDLQDKDTELYDKAEIAVNDLSKRIFIILNRLSGNDDALKACENFEAKLRGGSLGMGFVDCLIADCSDANEAQDKVLDVVINYLTQNITTLDFELAKSCQDNLRSIHKAVQKALEDSRKIFGDFDDDDYQDIEETYSELFGDKDSGWWREIILKLQELRSEIWYQRQAPNDDLYEAFTTALNLCIEDKGVLSKENVLDLINEQIRVDGAFRAYPDYQDELRVLISHRFLALDSSLKKTVEKMKTRIAEILKTVGQLDTLSTSEGTLFFQEVYNFIPDKYKNLKEGFRIIAKFHLSYRGLILPRVRQHLDGLTNITAMAGYQGFAEPQEDQTLAVSANTTADEIFAALDIDYDKAIYRLKPALEELLCEPNEAVFAMVEEFIDNVIRQQGIDREWKNFLRRYKGRIWGDAFGEQEQARQVRKDWLEAAKSLESFNQSQLFSFIQ